jgi:hypothetical protein
MSGLFGNDRAAKQQLEMQRQANAREDARLKKQEMQLAEEKAEEAKRVMAQANARRRGGARSLLSMERVDSEAGLPELPLVRQL